MEAHAVRNWPFILSAVASPNYREQGHACLSSVGGVQVALGHGERG